MRLSVCGIAVEGPHQLYVNLALSNKIMMITTVTLMMMTMTMMIIVMMIMDPHVFSCVFHFFLSSKWHWSKRFVGYSEEQLTN